MCYKWLGKKSQTDLTLFSVKFAHLFIPRLYPKKGKKAGAAFMTNDIGKCDMETLKSFADLFTKKCIQFKPSDSNTIVNCDIKTVIDAEMLDVDGKN